MLFIDYTQGVIKHDTFLPLSEGPRTTRKTLSHSTATLNKHQSINHDLG